MSGQSSVSSLEPRTVARVVGLPCHGVREGLPHTPEQSPPARPIAKSRGPPSAQSRCCRRRDSCSFETRCADGILPCEALCLADDQAGATDLLLRRMCGENSGEPRGLVEPLGGPGGGCRLPAILARQDPRAAAMKVMRVRLTMHVPNEGDDAACACEESSEPPLRPAPLRCPCGVTLRHWLPKDAEVSVNSPGVTRRSATSTPRSRAKGNQMRSHRRSPARVRRRRLGYQYRGYVVGRER